MEDVVGRSIFRQVRSSSVVGNALISPTEEMTGIDEHSWRVSNSPECCLSTRLETRLAQEISALSCLGKSPTRSVAYVFDDRIVDAFVHIHFDQSSE